MQRERGGCLAFHANEQEERLYSVEQKVIESIESPAMHLRILGKIISLHQSLVPNAKTKFACQGREGKWREGKALHCPTALYARSLAQDLEWEGEALREGDPFSNRGGTKPVLQARTKAVKAATTSSRSKGAKMNG